MKKALMAVLVVVMGLSLMGLDCFGGKGAPYYPLAEGNKWEYSGTTTTTMDYPEGEHMPADTSWETSMTSVNEVIGEVDIPGADMKGWEVKSTTTLEGIDPVVSTAYVRVENDSVYTYDKDGALTSTYPADPAVGEEWTVSTTTFKVEADGKEANGYTGCLEVSATPDDTSMFTEYSSLAYWAKDVGQVLMTMKTVATSAMGDGDLVTTIESETKLDTFTE